MEIMAFNNEESIGTVFSVDTTTIIVKIEDVERLKKLQVNHLVAIRSSKAGQHLIGLINKITRKLIDDTFEINDIDEISDYETRVENVIRVTLIGTLIGAVKTSTNIFRRTIETVPEIDAECFVLEGSRLTEFMKSITNLAISSKYPFSLGKYTMDDEAEAWVDGNKFFQRHAVIVGSTGSGKSWTTAKVIEQAAELPNVNAILIDIHGEYKSIVGDGIQHFRVAGPGDIDKNSQDKDAIFLPYWILTYEEMLALLLDRSDSNAPNQAMVFSREVTSAKREFLVSIEKSNVLANFTIDSPVPYNLKTVVERLDFLNTERVTGSSGRPKNGDFNGKLARFIQRLEAKTNDRRLGFLFSERSELSEYEWLDKLAVKILGSTQQQGGKGGIKVIDFSEVPSDILPLIVGLVARIVFSIQQWTNIDTRHPIAIICDEAHLYIPERISNNSINESSVNSFERIAKEGRKYGVSLVVVSQRPSEVNRTVLSQCNNYIAMRLSNAEDQAVIKRLMPDNLGGFSELLPILDVGEALVVGDATILPSRIRISEPKNKPLSETVKFWECWSREDIKNGIVDAVEALRCQTKH